MVAAFYATPQVAEARARLDKARESLAQTERIARSPNDPARIAAQKSVDDAQRQLDILWTKMKPTLARANQTGADSGGRACEPPRSRRPRLRPGSSSSTTGSRSSTSRRSPPEPTS